MPNRTAKFVSAIFASVLAGAPLTPISHGEAVAADNCLSGPKGETPPGSHWYYRIEHSTKRHCWHLREEGDSLSQDAPQTQAAPQNILPPPKPPAPQANPATRRSVDNARAELPAQTNRNEEPNTAWPAIAQGVNDASRANATDANAGSAVVASRWPEPSGVSPASSPRPAPSNLADNEPANPIARSAPPVAVVNHATADSSSQNEPGPIPRWFVAVVGPVAFGSIAASLFFKFGRSRRQRRTAVRARRRPVWEQTDDDRIVLSDYPDADVIPRRPQFARGIDQLSSDDRMAEFLARTSRRAPT
jgi:hypothetical protein